jgi:hypothetical protein
VGLNGATVVHADDLTALDVGARLVIPAVAGLLEFLHAMHAPTGAPDRK